jgi:hypothetical protein
MKLITVIAAGAGVIAALALAGCNHEPEFMAKQASACDIAAKPGDYDGHLVRVKSVYIADGLSVHNLIDDRCPGVFVAVQDADGIQKNHEYNTLDEEVNQAQAGRKGIPAWNTEIYGVYHKGFGPNGRVDMTRVVSFQRAGNRDH